MIGGHFADRLIHLTRLTMKIYCTAVVPLSMFLTIRWGSGVECGHRTDGVEPQLLPPWIVRIVWDGWFDIFGTLVQYDQRYFILTAGDSLSEYVDKFKTGTDFQKSQSNSYLKFAYFGQWSAEPNLTAVEKYVADSDGIGVIVMKSQFEKAIIRPSEGRIQPICLPDETSSDPDPGGFSVAHLFPMLIDNATEINASVVPGSRCPMAKRDPKSMFCAEAYGPNQILSGAAYYTLTPDGRYTMWGVEEHHEGGKLHAFRRVSSQKLGELLSKKKSRFGLWRRGS